MGVVLQANSSQDRVRGSLENGKLHDLGIVKRVHIVSGGGERGRNVNYCDSEKKQNYSRSKLIDASSCTCVYNIGLRCTLCYGAA